MQLGNQHISNFRDAIEEGVKQGEKIGKMIWEKITKKDLLIPSTN